MNHDLWTIAASILLGLAAAFSADWLLMLIDAINRAYSRSLNRAGDVPAADSAAALDWMRWWWAATLGVALILGLLLKMPVVAAVVTVILVLSPRAILAWQRDRRRIKIRNQLVGAARSLASQFRAGLVLTEGLRHVARDTAYPLGRELRRCVDEYGAGATIYDSLNSLKTRLNIDAVSLFVVALLACESKGGKVTEAMDNISRSLDELQRIEQKKESVTAGGRALVMVLAMFPAFFIGLFAMLDPRSLMLLFTTVPGQVVVSIVIVLTYASVRWALHIIAAVE